MNKRGFRIRILSESEAEINRIQHDSVLKGRMSARGTGQDYQSREEGEEDS